MVKSSCIVQIAKMPLLQLKAPNQGATLQQKTVSSTVAVWFLHLRNITAFVP